MCEHTLGGGSEPRNSQKHWSAFPAYPHTTQEFLVISWLRNAFSRSRCARCSPSYPIIDPFANLLNLTRLSVGDEEERTRYRSLGTPYRKRTYNATTESTVMLPVGNRVEGCPKTPSVTRSAIKGRASHKQSGHCDTVESSSQGVIFCSAARYTTSLARCSLPPQKASHLLYHSSRSEPVILSHRSTSHSRSSLSVRRNPNRTRRTSAVAPVEVVVF